MSLTRRAARAPPQDEFAPLQRVNSGPLPGSRATCAYGALLSTGGSLAVGGARTRVNVYGTAGGTRVFYLALPEGYDAAGAPPRPLLLALHGGASYGDGFLDGAPPAHAAAHAARLALTHAARAQRRRSTRAAPPPATSSPRPTA